MDHFLQRRDLPSFFRVQNVADRDLQLILNEAHQIPRAQGLILNTFEDLEGPILAQARSRCPNIYTIGPLHTHLKNQLPSPISSNSLWEEDSNCMTWSDTQPSKSVIYVSFGSITMATKDVLMEFWHATEERGYIVGWAPQEEVLNHPAIGGFLTHSGWNSTLESMVAGVPMICWLMFADQTTKSRFVGEAWKLGLDMKDTCERITIEKMVRDLMVVRKDEFVQSANRMTQLAREAVSEGGSSYCNWNRLMEYIRSMVGQGEFSNG
ncbi:UDP-Glycosyltransferase superfamily protein [Actinidia rufa]|uniref:UDP-Glycosyltransferase superfamily protein n=1 Tax=Actinidia rufa TaxID=165716 RepID=A0A7J0EAR4_9ERIC|nr:UDP-Glycosyltransferase superfamily protein [Actinidia rufa]